MKYIVWCLLFCLAISCKQKQQTYQKQLDVISVAKAFDEKTTIPLSRVAESVEYIQLETKKECTLRSNPKLFITDKYIITLGWRQIYLFDRKTGCFIREIGKFDFGPGGYANTIYVMPFDKIHNVIRAKAHGPNKYHCYNLNGDLVYDVKSPVRTRSVASLNDDLYAGFIQNLQGNESVKMILFDKSGKCIKKFKNDRTFEPVNSVVSWGIHGWFYHFKNTLSFYELFTDTIFEVTPEKLIPKFAFDLGEYAPPYDQQAVSDFLMKKSKDYFILREMYETDSELLFRIRYDGKHYLGLYDKTSGNTIMNTKNKDYPAAFDNDIDSLLPFTFSSVSASNELLGYMNSYEVEKWLKENSEKASQLPKKLQWMKKLMEEDNPVVMIANLKE